MVIFGLALKVCSENQNHYKHIGKHSMINEGANIEVRM
jgi:hypothetical protein